MQCYFTAVSYAKPQTSLDDYQNYASRGNHITFFLSPLSELYGFVSLSLIAATDHSNDGLKNISQEPNIETVLTVTKHLDRFLLTYLDASKIWDANFWILAAYGGALGDTAAHTSITYCATPEVTT